MRVFVERRSTHAVVLRIGAGGDGGRVGSLRFLNRAGSIGSSCPLMTRTSFVAERSSLGVNSTTSPCEVSARSAVGSLPWIFVIQKKKITIFL
jgi:hypothetical protein